MCRRFHQTAAIVAVITLPIGATRSEPLQDGKGGPPGAVERAADDPVAVARDQLKVARQALEMIRRSSQLGAPITDQYHDVYRWSQRVLGAQLFLSLPEDGPRTADPEVYLGLASVAPTPDRTKAFEDHLARMQEWESILRPLYERGILSALEFLEIQSHRLEAEFWVARERGRINDGKAASRR